MRFLVTGGSGFIGRSVVKALLERGDTVVAPVRSGATAPSGSVAVPVHDWSDDGLTTALSGHNFDVVIHLASYGVAPGDRDPVTMRRVNALLPASIVDLAASRDAVVVTAGSNAEYAAAERDRREDSPLESAKLYGATKAAGGLLAASTAVAREAPFAHLRYFNVYGPGEAPHRLLPSVYRGLAAGERVALSTGEQIRDFIHLEDVVAATLHAVDTLRSGKRPPGAAFNVCRGTGESVGTLARMVCRHMGADESLLGFGDLPMRPDDIPRLVGDPEALAGWTGWRAKVDLEAGVESTLSWLRNMKRQR